MADLIELCDDSTIMRSYYRDSRRPPYLRRLSPSAAGGGDSTETGGGGGGGGGDPTLAAAGGGAGAGGGGGGAAASGLLATAGTPSSGNIAAAGAHQADDAAGGGGTPGVAEGFRGRVSSFNLLPRVASVDAVLAGHGLMGASPAAAAMTPSHPGGGGLDQHFQHPPPEDGRWGLARDGRRRDAIRRREIENERRRLRTIKPDWRLKDRMKTVGVGLVMALNVGTDPPDLAKPHPCAVLECWIDPRSVSRSKAKEIIGERLEQQYAKWQLARAARPLKYRRALDPTVDDVRALCLQLRRQARNERVLIHYNGHGVPRPTANGEIWVFDKNHTEYTPLSIMDLRQWMGKPSIVVLDCSAAGILIPSFQAPLAAAGSSSNPQQQQAAASASTSRDSSMDDLLLAQHHWVNDTIVLCPCSENQWLPMSPDYPADIFTSCLTTPIPIALRWFVRNHASSSMSGIHPDAVDAIPGKANDRKTPLGELNWIFTAVTDSIAWNSLPKPLFQRLFRQDLLVASMFRNFLLADRILRSLGCTPVSYPPLPETADHPLWRAWDLACETLLYQLVRDGVLGSHTVVAASSSSSSPSSGAGNQGQQQQSSSSSGGGGAGGDNDRNNNEAGGDIAGETSSVASTTAPARVAPPPPPVDPSNFTYAVSSPFFSEQLTAFEVWLDYSPIHKMQLKAGVELESPQELPVVLQVLLSQTHRIRALVLLRRFLDLGPWAVNLSLSLGIFPYVMKLLQSPEYKSLLVSIWASILAFDPSCRVDLIKDGAFHHFVQHLLWGLDNSNNPAAASMNLADAAKERTMAAYVLAAACHEYPAGQAECIRLNLHGNCCALLSSYEQANMVKDNTATQNEAYGAGVHTRILARLNDKDANVRTAVCYALGCLIGSRPKQGSRTPSTQELTSLQQHQYVQMQGQGGGTATGGLMSQRMGTPSNMVVAGTIPATGAVGAGMPGQLQPTFTNLQWRPQHMEPIQGMGVNAASLGQQVPAAAQFMNQPAVQLRPAHQGQALQAQYVMHGQPMQAGPPGFLVGGNPVVGTGGQPQLVPHQMHQQQLHQQQQLVPEVPRQAKPSVFEDRRRLELDLTVMNAVLKAIHDASIMVRYEATVALANAVGKYLDAFVIVAEEAAVSPPPHEEQSFPRGLNRKMLTPFSEVWRALRTLQHDDPFPAVAGASKRIVGFVHEHLLRIRMESSGNSDQNPEDLHSKILAEVLAGIDEEYAPPKDSSAPSTPPRLRPTDNSRRSMTTGSARNQSELRRTASATDGSSSMEQNALGSASQHTPSKGLTELPMNFILPKSEYYEWKKSSFDTNFKSSSEALDDDDDDDDNGVGLDLMSPEGAARAYQQRRNFDVRSKGREIAARYASLTPKPPKPATRSIQMLLEEESEEALEAAEEQASAKKNELKLKQNRVLRDEGVQMTSMVRFHPFENVIISCGATDRMSMWDTESGKRLISFRNGNPEGSRITTSSWMNEESSSLFFVGCDDGSVRIWGDILESTGEPSGRQPTLLSSFYALPMEAGRRGSGLVCEWQGPFSGIMLAGGNSNKINCWDLEYERRICQIETNTDANVTTLTTAWDFDQLGMGSIPQGYHGIGREIFVAGHSDGTLKVFDLRTHCKPNELRGSTPLPQTQRPRRRATGYSEHKSWVVATAFTGYSSRYELVSGTLTGEIKAWDLRLSSSIRTIEAQRSTMTALSVHSKIPVVATGSHAQFIKVLTLDGDTVTVLRYHEKLASHRIGPVSCLEFHRYKPLLAAGFTDEYVGLYTPMVRV